MRHARSDYDHIQDLREVPGLRAAYDDAMNLQAMLPSISGGSDLEEISGRLSRLLQLLYPLIMKLDGVSEIAVFPHDEPVFLLRAKDRTAPSIVRAWARLNQSNGKPLFSSGVVSQIAASALAHADRMEDYAREHYQGGKEADAPESALRV